MSKRLTQHLVKSRYFEDAPLTIVDVGVRGGFERHWNQYWPDVRLYGIEADEKECEHLRKITGPDCMLIEACVATGSEKRTFYETVHPSSSSLYAPDPVQCFRFPWDKTMVVMGTREVETVSLDAVLKDIRSRVDYIKLDCEGAEVEIMTGAPDTMRSAIAISTEVVFQRVRLGQPTFPQVDALLQDYGFQLYHLKGYRHARATMSLNPFPENRGQMLWAQALYFRDVPAELEAGPHRHGWTPRRVMCAVTLLESMGFQDVAMEAIQAADRNGLFNDADIEIYLNLLTPTVDGQVVTYRYYWDMQRAVVDGDGARAVVANYFRNWHGRIG